MSTIPQPRVLANVHRKGQPAASRCTALRVLHLSAGFCTGRRQILCCSPLRATAVYIPDGKMTHIVNTIWQWWRLHIGALTSEIVCILQLHGVRHCLNAFVLQLCRVCGARTLRAVIIHRDREGGWMGKERWLCSETRATHPIMNWSSEGVKYLNRSFFFGGTVQFEMTRWMEGQSTQLECLNKSKHISCASRFIVVECHCFIATTKVCTITPQGEKSQCSCECVLLPFVLRVEPVQCQVHGLVILYQAR